MCLFHGFICGIYYIHSRVHNAMVELPISPVSGIKIWLTKIDWMKHLWNGYHLDLCYLPKLNSTQHPLQNTNPPNLLLNIFHSSSCWTRTKTRPNISQLALHCSAITTWVVLLGAKQVELKEGGTQLTPNINQHETCISLGTYPWLCCMKPWSLNIIDSSPSDWGEQLVLGQRFSINVFRQLGDASSYLPPSPSKE